MPIARHLVFVLTAVGVFAAFAAPSAHAAEGFELARDGRSDVGLVLPDDAPAEIRAAADTLRRYVRLVSGAELREAPAGGPRLVLALVDDPALGPDGFRIRTRPDTLTLAAATADGIRHAVYTFLESRLGCRKYDTGPPVAPRRPTVVLPPGDDVQVPRFTFRMQDLKDPTYLAWHKLDTNAGFGLFVHTFGDLVPPDRWFADHPEYFSLLNGHRMPTGQLCLTNPDVFDLVVRELRARMAARPEADFWSVSQNDTYSPCECDACRALDEAAGSHAGSILAFVNRVADVFPDKTISTLAYQYSRTAPRGIAPRPNVNIMLCSIECDRSRPLAEHPGSAGFVRDVRAWGELTSNIFLWDYVIQFRNLVSPFPNLRVLQPNLQFFAASGLTAVFEQGLPLMHGEFAELRIYLLAKLLWDPDIDLDALMDDFLAGYYGAAAPFVRTYIDTMHDALAATGEGLSIYGYPLASDDGHLAPARVAAYDDLLQRAEAAVRDDPVAWRRTRTARLPVLFARLEQAKAAADGRGGCFTRHADGSLHLKPGYEEMLTTFVDGCLAAGIPRLWEHGTPPEAYRAATRRFFTASATPHRALGHRVVLDPPASPKYHDGEAAALTDGLRGWDDYRFHWLGFEGTDMVATIDLGAVVPVSGVAADFLQDILSWVFMPTELTVELSTDGRTFQPAGAVRNTVPPETGGAVVAPFEVVFAPRPARYVRVTATSLQTCPTWHKGSGGPAWIFTDEIVVRTEPAE
ncbi:DUF4838 domain-containing protein [bacterium]|nr:DUF4838 domain-containing protein [bacterium]